MIVYIAGPTLEHPTDWVEYAKAEEELEKLGCIVLNPAWMSYKMPHDAHMPIRIAMLEQADAVYMLPGWVDSLGATVERQFALYQNKPIFEDIKHADLAVLAGFNFGR